MAYRAVKVVTAATAADNGTLHQLQQPLQLLSLSRSSRIRRPSIVCVQSSQHQHARWTHCSTPITSRVLWREASLLTDSARSRSPSFQASPKTVSRRNVHTSPSNHRFRFLISHSFQGKPTEPDSPQGPPAKSTSAPPKKQIGWPDNTPVGRWRDALLGGGTAGEDSLMVATTNGVQEGQIGDVAIGVADGVGSWSENGVDPALFSQALMYHASEAFCSAQGASDPIADPGRLISEGYKQVLADSRVPAGSSTAVVVTLDSTTGMLRSANLGDSGFIVLREGSFVSQVEAPSDLLERDLGRGRGTPGKRPLPGTLYRSSPQQYYFNAPYQLSKIPVKVMEQWKRENGGESPSLECSPELASRWECKLKHGDIVVVGSDGVWDNVWGKEWVALVNFLKEKHHEVFESHKATSPSARPSAMSESRWEEEKTLVEIIAYK